MLLVLDPWLVWAIGFQLSVAATAGMVALGTPLAGRLGRVVPTPVALAGGALCLLGGYLVGVVAGPDTEDTDTATVVSYDEDSDRL